MLVNCEREREGGRGFVRDKVGFYGITRGQVKKVNNKAEKKHKQCKLAVVETFYY